MSILWKWHIFWTFLFTWYMSVCNLYCQVAKDYWKLITLTKKYYIKVVSGEWKKVTIIMFCINLKSQVMMTMMPAHDQRTSLHLQVHFYNSTLNLLGITGNKWYFLSNCKIKEHINSTLNQSTKRNKLIYNNEYYK